MHKLYVMANLLDLQRQWVEAYIWWLNVNNAVSTGQLLLYVTECRHQTEQHSRVACLFSMLLQNGEEGGKQGNFWERGKGSQGSKPA